jgi:diguanylate cyclase (GGDEF)-like protein
MTRILVVDDDAHVAQMIALALEVEGYQVEVVHDGAAALRVVADRPPALVLLDVMMSGLGGVEVLRRLRAGVAHTALPVLLLTAMSESSDKVTGLNAGADDYVVKPFDPAELVARVQRLLRRTAEVREVSPLTGLPGNGRITAEVTARHASGARYAVCHVDLDRFKSFNDAYGFLRGDGVLRALADCLVEVARQAGEPMAFVGHVGGDDFVVVCTPAQVAAIADRVVERFDTGIAAHYDADSRARGYLEAADRRGQPVRHPMVSVSIGVGLQRDASNDYRAVVAAAAEMKNWAKTQPGSAVAVDRRG